jgi:hypothetical protein
MLHTAQRASLYCGHVVELRVSFPGGMRRAIIHRSRLPLAVSLNFDV